jgi:protein-S-isoprenylcysteine O-methyltransferase Ste14
MNIHFVIFFIALFSFAIYSFAIKTLFSDVHGVSPRMQCLKACGLVSIFTHLISIWHNPQITANASVLSMSIYICGLLIFFLARSALKGRRLTLAFSPDPPQWLVSNAVYAYIRHPFYLAYSLTWLGGVIAAPAISTISTTLLMICLYWSAAKYEERKFYNSPYVLEYIDYQKRTGMFLPSIFSSYRIR